MAKTDITLRATTFFLTGILLASYIQNIYELLIPTVLGVFLFWFLRKPAIAMVAVSALPFIIGSIYYFAYIFRQNSRINIPYGQKISSSAVVLKDAAKNSYGSINYIVQLPPPLCCEVAVSTSMELYPVYGDVISFEGTASRPETVYELPIVSMSKITITSHGSGNAIKRCLLNVKRKFIFGLSLSLPPREAALAAGLTVGERAEFSREDKRAMALSGTTHLVALSGYNIAILAEAIRLTLKGRLRKRLVFFITISIIILFVVAVGGEPSIVRAAIMGGLALLAGELGRENSIAIAILFSAFLMGLQDPRIVRWDIGFQLSFMSLLGIVYLAPSITRAIRFNTSNSFLGWKESLVMSASAQIMVLPFSLGIFGSASLSGILANVALTTFIPITMLLVFISGALGMVSSAFSTIAAWFTEPFLAYELWVIHFFANPWASIGEPSNGNILFAFYYAAVIFFIKKHYAKD
ncbi:MAG: ComEC/Rec2 family competence protein [Candidatus Liptonbacteria bacterium]